MAELFGCALPSSSDDAKQSHFEELAQRLKAATRRSSSNSNLQSRNSIRRMADCYVVAPERRRSDAQKPRHRIEKSTAISRARATELWKGRLDGVEDDLIDAVFGIGSFKSSDVSPCLTPESRQDSESSALGEQSDSPPCWSSTALTPDTTLSDDESRIESPIFVAALEPSGSLMRFSETGFLGWGSFHLAMEDMKAPVSL